MKIKTQEISLDINNNFNLIKYDGPLMILISITCLLGIFILYSASNESLDVLNRQIFRIFIAFTAMMLVSQIPTEVLRKLSPWGYIGGIILLSMVLWWASLGKVPKDGLISA